MSLVLRLPREMHLCRSSSNFPHLPSGLLQNLHMLLTFGRVENPLCLAQKTTLQHPKAARTCGALYILTSKCASRHNSVHLLNILTSKSAPRLRCFVHFDCKCASRHNGVQCSSLIWPAGSAPAALASLLFDPLGTQIIGKTQWLATLLPFRAPGSSFFWDFLFFGLLSFSLLFSDSSHLCFSCVHTVGSLTSKLPSNSASQTTFSAWWRQCKSKCLIVNFAYLNVLTTLSPLRQHTVTSDCQESQQSWWGFNQPPRLLKGLLTTKNH